MSSAFGEMGNLLKQAQQMQRELDRAREELRSTSVEGASGGGAVKTVVNGEGMLLKITIRPEVLSGAEPAMVEDLVLAAVRDGLTRAQTTREARLAKVTGGISLPGIL